MTDTTKLAERIEALEPYLGKMPPAGGDGQGLGPLESLAIAADQKPSYRSDRVDTSHLSLVDGTTIIQWVGRKPNGYFYPLGRPMQATTETPVFLRKAAETAPDYSRPYILRAADKIENRLRAQEAHNG